MVKKEITSTDELKKELEESKAKLALLNKKSRHSVKTKRKKKGVKNPDIKKINAHCTQREYNYV